MNTVIEVICCLCGKHMGEIDGNGTSGISHSYCPECAEAELKKLMDDGTII